MKIIKDTKIPFSNASKIAFLGFVVKDGDKTYHLVRTDDEDLLMSMIGREIGSAGKIADIKMMEEPFTTNYYGIILENETKCAFSPGEKCLLKKKMTFTDGANPVDFEAGTTVVVSDTETPGPMISVLFSDGEERGVFPHELLSTDTGEAKDVITVLQDHIKTAEEELTKATTAGMTGLIQYAMGAKDALEKVRQSI